MNDKRSCNEDLNRALKLEVVKAEAGPPLRLWEGREEPTWKHTNQQLSDAGQDDLYASSVATDTADRNMMGTS
jgi:hypothetical protein